MRTFKLIKTYPGGPEKLGLEITNNKEHLDHFYNEQEMIFMVISPENFPDNWEEVLSVNSKILFRTEDGVAIYDGDKAFCVGLRDSEKYQIFSVNSSYATSKNYLWFSTYDKAKKYVNSKVLFQTEDGVDIFIGSRFCYVRDQELFSYHGRLFIANDKTPKYKEAFYFSTLQKAQEYILNNKVLLVTEDGGKIRMGDSYYRVNIHDGHLSVWEMGSTFSNSDIHVKFFSTISKAMEYSKTREVLLTTDDGGLIREGDKIWGINVMDLNIFSCNIYANCNQITEEWIHGKFSSEKFAEDFLVLNKPCLSLVDISKYYHKLLDFSNGNSKGLKKLVETRIKK